MLIRGSSLETSDVNCVLIKYLNLSKTVISKVTTAVVVSTEVTIVAK